MTNDEIDFIAELVKSEVEKVKQEIVAAVVSTFVDLAMGQLAYFGVGEDVEGEDGDGEEDEDA